MNYSDANQISCDFWKTPVTGVQTLWLSNQLYTTSNNYFFFENAIDDPTRFVYVLTISALDAFKLSDESDSSVRIDKLLENKLPGNRDRARSYKIWNSPYALEASYRLGMTSREYDETEKFQYLIVTQNVTIEFVTIVPPKWEKYEGMNLDDLVIQYLKKDS